MSLHVGCLTAYSSGLQHKLKENRRNWRMKDIKYEIIQESDLYIQDSLKRYRLETSNK